MKLISYLLLILLLSCSKQEPEKLESTHRREDITQNKDCEKVVFLDEPISKENLNYLLSCMGWSKDYPALVKAIESFDEEKLDYISKPFNESFFEDRAKRNSYFSLFSLLNQDKSKGFESLSNYIKELLPPWSKLANSYFQYAKERDTLAFLQKIKFDKENVRTEIELYSSIQKYFLLNTKFSKKLAIALQDSELVEKISGITSGFDSIDSNLKTLIAKVFWGKNGIINSAVTAKKNSFLSLSKFITDNYEAIRNIGIELNESYQSRIQCKVDSSKKYYLEMHNYLKDEVLFFTSAKTSNWPGRLTEIAHRIHLTSIICPNDQILNVKDDALKAISSIDKLCQNPGDCEMFQSLLTELGPENINQLYKYLASDNFVQFKEFLDYFLSNHLELLKEFDVVLNKVPQNFLDRARHSFIINEENTSLSMTLLKIINSFNGKERVEGARLLGLFVKNKEYVKHVNPFFLEMFTHFPELSVEYLKLYQKNPDYFYESVSHFLSLLQGSTINEFTEFLSLKSLLKLFKQFSGKSIGAQLVLKYLSLVEKPIKAKNYKATTDVYQNCLSQLQDNYVLLSKYADRYPKSCEKTAHGFIHHLSQNLKIADSNIDLRYFDDFYNAELLAQLSGISKQYKKFLINKNRSSLDSSSAFLDMIKDSDLGKFLDGLLSTANFQYWNKKFTRQESISALRRLPLAGNVKVKLTKKNPILKCLKRDKSVGALYCMDQKQLKNWLSILKETTLRKNEDGQSVLSELLNMFYQKTGVPYQNPEKYIKIELKDFIAFFHQLSQKETEEYLIYKYTYGEKAVPLTVLEQIEMLLREISFSDNYFGAYFKNDIANSSNYIKSVKTNKRLFNNGGSWLLKLFGYIKDRHGLEVENASNTFDSLVKLDEEYKVGKDVFRFGNITHSILVALVKSSSITSQNISIKNKPNSIFTKGHNGYFLTHFAKVGGLSFIGEYFKSRFLTLEKLFRSDEFKAINEKLFKKIKKEDLESFLVEIFKNVDNDTFIENMQKFSNLENPKWARTIENILSNFFYIISVSDLNNDQVKNLLSIGNSITQTLAEKNYKIEDLEVALSFINNLFEYLKLNLNDANQILKIVSVPDFPKNIAFLVSFTQSFNSSMEFYQFMNVILSGIDYQALDAMLFKLSKSAYVLRPKDRIFNRLLNGNSFISNKSLSLHLESFLNDLNEHILITK